MKDENRCIAPDGTPLVAVPELGPNSCDGCWFKAHLGPSSCYVDPLTGVRPSCSSRNRSDRRDIIWVPDDPVDPNPL